VCAGLCRSARAWQWLRILSHAAVVLRAPRYGCQVLLLATPAVLCFGLALLRATAWRSLVIPASSICVTLLCADGTGVAYAIASSRSLIPGYFPALRSAPRKARSRSISSSAAVIVTRVLARSGPRVRAPRKPGTANYALFLDLSPTRCPPCARGCSEADIPLERSPRKSPACSRPGEKVPVDGVVLEGKRRSTSR